eukprot:jgi/Mesvir1/9933/Mv06636-RA.1
MYMSVAVKSFIGQVASCHVRSNTFNVNALRLGRPASSVTWKPACNSRQFHRYKPAHAMSEEAKAREAAGSAQEVTIFDKIVAKQIPADVIYEDDLCMAFRDISPQAPVHTVLIPKVRGNLSQLSKAQESDKELLGHLFYTAQLVAKQEKLDKGFRVVVNDGPEGCQSVYHLHLHIIGGRQLRWPPG